MRIPITLFENYLKNKGLKKRSIKNYIYYFNRFSYDRFNQESLSKFLSESSNRNSIGRSFLVHLKRFLIVNKVELKIDQEYYHQIIETELPIFSGRKKQVLVNPIPHDQIPLLEDALESEKLKIQLWISYYGALRIGEMIKIRILSFNWDEWKKNPERWGECRVYGKGDKEGIALLPPDLMKRIARYILNSDFLDVGSYLFIKESMKTEVKDIENRGRDWQIKIKDAGIKSGITKLDENKKAIHGTRVYPHRLRHSYAFHLLKDKNMDIRYIQEALRHTSIKSTQIYTLVNKEELKRKLEEVDGEDGK